MQEMSELELKNGKSYRFADQYETIEAKINYARTINGSYAYKIWVNNKPVFISKTFKPIAHELNELIDKYKLKELKSI